MSHKLYNPKANAPSVYIPAWLSQVPSKKLTPSCKMVYGRLAQWANSSGRAHRSSNQLSQELGIPARTVEDCLKTLKSKGLIGSYQRTDGGHNHFEFYDHPWMHEQINENLCYKCDQKPPPADFAEGSADFAEGSADFAVHKIKEIKEIKNNNNIPDFSNRGENISSPLYKKDSRFMRFYSEYPKKEDPHDAYKAFKQIIGDDDVLLEQIIEDIKLRKTTHSKWGDKQFIKYPAVYLRKGEYLGEIFNIKDESEKKKTEEKELVQIKCKEQERLSKIRGEEEIKNTVNKQKDGAIYRGLTKSITNERNTRGLKELKNILKG